MDKVTFKVRPSMKQKFNTIVRKLDRCLKAGGFGGFQPRLVGECDIHVDSFVNERRCHYVVKGEEFEAELPVDIAKLGDYRLIGEYRRVDDGRWMKIMHSDDVKDQYEVREDNFRCDHCGRNIRNRNGYYFLRDKDDNLIVVGSTCVDEFLGMDVRGLLDALGDVSIFLNFSGEPGEIDFEKEVICVGMNTNEISSSKDAIIQSQNAIFQNLRVIHNTMTKAVIAPPTNDTMPSLNIRSANSSMDANPILEM